MQTSPRSTRCGSCGGVIPPAQYLLDFGYTPRALLNNMEVMGVDGAKTQALIINGVTIAPGTFPAGVSFPVTGPINDPQCFFGAETFSGTLVAQETQFTGDGTTAPSIKLTGLHLVGDATCSTQETIALTLFRTHYDLAIGGTTLTQQEKSGNGTLHIIIQPVYSLLPLGDS